MPQWAYVFISDGSITSAITSPVPLRGASDVFASQKAAAPITTHATLRVASRLDQRRVPTGGNYNSRPSARGFKWSAQMDDSYRLNQSAKLESMVFLM